MTEQPEIIMPIGWEAGRPFPVVDALAGVVMEMMGHRSDLLQLAEDRRRPELEREGLTRRAVDLERYATALQSVVMQLRPERWQPEHMGGMIEMARQNSVTLPEWMTKDE